MHPPGRFPGIVAQTDNPRKMRLPFPVCREGGGEVVRQANFRSEGGIKSFLYIVVCNTMNMLRELFINHPFLDDGSVVIS